MYCINDCMVISNLIISLVPQGECNDFKKVYILASLFGAAIAVEANTKRQAVTFILKPEIRNKIRVLSTTQAKLYTPSTLNIQMKLIRLWVLAERAVLGRAKTALKFKYEI